MRQIKSAIELAIAAKLLQIERRIARRKLAPLAPRTKELAAEFAKDKP